MTYKGIFFFKHKMSDEEELNNLWNSMFRTKIREDDNDTSFHCPSCKSDKVFQEEGSMLCHQCHTMFGSIILSNAEWRYYGNDDNRGQDPSRCGMSENYLIPDAHLGTIITYRRNESYTMKKIRKYHSWNSMNYKGRNLYHIFEQLNVRCDTHGIPSIISDHTKHLYKKITDKQLFRGENKNGLMAICMYRACKEKNVPRSIKEIASIFQVDEQVMTKGNRCFGKVWNLFENTTPSPPSYDLLEKEEDESMMMSSRPIHYIDRFCNRLHITSTNLELITKTTLFLEEHKIIADNTPSCIAAVVIYFICKLKNMNISKSDISNVSQISEVTIGKCFKKLNQYTEYIKQEVF